MTSFHTKLKARTELALRNVGLKLSFIESHVGSKKYLVKEDKERNVIFIGPTGKLVVISTANKVFTSNNWYCILFNDGTKYPQYKFELFELAEGSKIEVDFSNPNLKEVSLVKESVIGLPKVIIKDTAEYPQINWKNYLGKEVYVELLGNKTKQIITSIGLISKEDSRLIPIILRLIADSRTTPNIEVGKWVIFGKKMVYESDIFTSGRFKEIQAKDAFQKLAETIKIALQKEAEVNLKRLSLLHTHPISGAPLSVQDITGLQAIAKQLDVGKEEIVEVFAVPTPDNGSVVFKYVLK